MKEKQQYIVRKYIMATSARDAINKDKETDVSDVCVDQDWVKNNNEQKPSAMGFMLEGESSFDEQC